MPAKIALGLGDNIDYEIVWDSQVIEGLVAQYAIQPEELLHPQPIGCERDLILSILQFLQSGKGGERFVDSSPLIEQFASRFTNKITLGGTSVRAAIAMHKLGYTPALHLVTLNDHVRRLIPPQSPYVCSNSQDTAYPHLIVQFDPGTRIQANGFTLRSSRANRIIYHNDRDNIALALNEEFADLIADAQVLLVSGFNAMQSELLLQERLDSLHRILRSLPKTAAVFYEDAAFYNPAFSQRILAALASQITIFSLNEDELQAHLGRSLDLLDVEQMAQALADLHRLIPVPTLVVHSMYWAIAYGHNSPALAAALKGGVTMATTRFCYGDDFGGEAYRTIEQRTPLPAGVHFAEALHRRLGQQVCCVPVAAVEQTNATTIGLGDAFVGGFLPALLS